MKLIFSRKGFDSSSGGFPSPLVDGHPISLPIPAPKSRIRYADLRNGIAEFVSDLSEGKISPEQTCHLDPDLDPLALPRKPDWRGAFGQVDSAQGHLEKCSVGAGDLFLFWGLFRPIQRSAASRWIYDGPSHHRIFGWLQVDAVLRIGADPSSALEKYPWLASHPHVAGTWPANNTIYIARERLALPGVEVDLPGWGRMESGHRLTAVGHPVSRWSVPSWMHPENGTGLTYHRRASRWTQTTLQTVARGQEFVADIQDRMEPIRWVADLLRGKDMT